MIVCSMGFWDFWMFNHHPTWMTSHGRKEGSKFFREMVRKLNKNENSEHNHPTGSWGNKEDIIPTFDWYVLFTHQSLDDNHLKRVYSQFGMFCLPNSLYMTTTQREFTIKLVCSVYPSFPRWQPPKESLQTIWRSPSKCSQNIEMNCGLDH